MANEIPNVSQAGLVLQVFGEDGADPAILASWGVDVETLEKIADPEGVYTVRLTNPASGIVSPGLDGFTSVDFVMLQSDTFVEQGSVMKAALIPATPLVPPTAGQSLQLTHIAIAVTTDGEPDDEAGTISLEVRKVPQQS